MLFQNDYTRRCYSAVPEFTLSREMIAYSYHIKVVFTIMQDKNHLNTKDFGIWIPTRG